MTAVDDALDRARTRRARPRSAHRVRPREHAVPDIEDTEEPAEEQPATEQEGEEQPDAHPAPAARKPDARPVPAPPGPTKLRSVLVLTGLLVGLPVLAVPSGGPGQLLDAFRLFTGDLSAPTMIALLQLVLGVVWFQVLSCASVEAVSTLRGVGMPARVPWAFARQQRLVRRHVAALLPTRHGTADEPDDEPWLAPVPAPVPQLGDADTDRPAAARAQRTPPRWDLADASLLSAGLLDAFADRRRRHRQQRSVGGPVPAPDAEAVAVELAAHLGADTAGAGLLDRALRHLAASVVAAGGAPVRLLAARVTADQIEVVLESARPDLPAPWSTSDGGRRWALPRAVEVPPIVAAAPAPAMVCLGGDGVGRVLLDLEAAQGVVCVTGDFDAVRSVVVAAALELITARWADEHTVTLVGFGDTLRSLGGRRVRCVATLAEVVEEITDRLEAGRQLARAAGDGLSAPELRASGDPRALFAARPEIVVLARPPEPAELAELTEWFLPAPERAPLAILVAGSLDEAVWQLELDADGVLVLDPLGHRVGAQAVSPRTYAALAEPAEQPIPTEDLLGRAYEPEQVRVLVRLFGWPDATGDIGPGDPTSLEIAAYLALRESATFRELGAAIWPGGVSDEERNVAVRRARWWLGLDAEGEPRLSVAGGKLTLSPEVQTDWAAALALPPSDPALRSTPGLLREEPVTPWPDGRFAWLAAEPLAHRIDALVADRCALAAAELLSADDRAAATQLLLAGLRVCPHATVLWMLLDAAAAAEDREMIRAVRDRRLAGLRF